MLESRGPVLRFAGLFAALVALIYLGFAMPLFQETLLPGYLDWLTAASEMVLSVLGSDVVRAGTTISSVDFSIEVNERCTAVEPSALFAAAVLAFPAPWRSRLSGVAAGVVVLAAINLVRIVTLYYAGVLEPAWVEVFHVDVWQPLFVLLALSLWVLWAFSALRARREPDGVAT